MKGVSYILICILAVFSSCKDDNDPEKEITPAEQQKANIVAELAKNEKMSTFLTQFENLDVSNLDAESLTVFAVSNSASDNITSNTVKRHIVKGLITREQLVDGAKFTSVDNTTLTVDVVGKAIYVNSVPVGNEIKAGNSIIYTLVRVMPAENTQTLEQQKLIISELRKTENLQAFADRIEALDLSEIDTDAFTVFAIEEEETSEPVQSLTDDEIRRHIVKGAWTAGSFTDGMALKAINNTELSVTVYNENKFLNGVLLWEDVPQIKRTGASIGSNIISVASRVFPLNEPPKYPVDFKFVRWNTHDGAFFQETEKSPYDWGLQEIGRFGYQRHSVSAYFRKTYSVNGIKISRDTLVRASSAPTIVAYGAVYTLHFKELDGVSKKIIVTETYAGSGSNNSIVQLKFMMDDKYAFPDSFQQWGWYKVSFRNDRKTNEVKLEDGGIRETYMVDISATHTNGRGHAYSFPIYVFNPAE